MSSPLRHFSAVPGLPEPRGPFSQAVAASGHFLHVSGQGPYDPQAGGFVRGNIAEQTRLTLACIKRIIESAGASIQDIIGAIQRVSAIIGEISAASGEQSSGVAQIGKAVAQIDQVTQQNAALVEQSAAAAESLKQQAALLVQAVSVFKLAA